MAFVVKERGSGTVIASAEAGQGVDQFEGNWYFDPDHVNMEHLKVTQRIYTCPYKGRCYWIDIDAPGVRATNIAWTYFDPKSGYEQIKGKIAFYARDTSGTTVSIEDAVNAEGQR